jgi:hypothetical protein
MKKTIFLLSAFALINASAFAQNKKSDSKKATKSAENVQNDDSRVCFEEPKRSQQIFGAIQSFLLPRR